MYFRGSLGRSNEFQGDVSNFQGILEISEAFQTVLGELQGLLCGITGVFVVPKVVPHGVSDFRSSGAFQGN